MAPVDGTDAYANQYVGGIAIYESPAGFFIYTGPPAAGNLVVSAVSSGVTDFKGNTSPAGLAIGSASGPQVTADLAGNLGVDGNLTVSGTLSNTALATSLSGFTSAIAANTAAIAANTSAITANTAAVAAEATRAEAAEASLQAQIADILNGCTITGNLHVTGSITGGSINISGGVTLGGYLFNDGKLNFLQSASIAANTGIAYGSDSMTNMAAHFNALLTHLQNANLAL
jgi:hypothetical protein